MSGRFRSFSFVDRITRREGGRVEGHYARAAGRALPGLADGRGGGPAGRLVVDGAAGLRPPPRRRAGQRGALPPAAAARLHAAAAGRHRALRRRGRGLQRQGLHRWPAGAGAGGQRRADAADGGIRRARSGARRLPHPARRRRGAGALRRRAVARSARSAGRAGRTPRRHAAGARADRGALLRRSFPAPAGVPRHAADGCAGRAVGAAGAAVRAAGGSRRTRHPKGHPGEDPFVHRARARACSSKCVLQDADAQRARLKVTARSEDKTIATARIEVTPRSAA